jgi:hypothetical protein
MKFKKGDRIMGLHKNVTGEMLINGNVDIAKNDRYILEIEGILTEDEALGYNASKFKQSKDLMKKQKHWKNKHHL